MVNFSNICRLCVSKLNNKAVNCVLAEQEHLKRSIKSLYNVKITPFDKAPTKICENCSKMVIKNTWDYVQVIQAQMTFQSEAFLSMPLKVQSLNNVVGVKRRAEPDNPLDQPKPKRFCPQAKPLLGQVIILFDYDLAIDFGTGIENHWTSESTKCFQQSMNHSSNNKDYLYKNAQHRDCVDILNALIDKEAYAYHIVEVKQTDDGVSVESPANNIPSKQLSINNSRADNDQLMASAIQHPKPQTDTEIVNTIPKERVSIVPELLPISMPPSKSSSDETTIAQSSTTLPKTVPKVTASTASATPLPPDKVATPTSIQVIEATPTETVNMSASPRCIKSINAQAKPVSLQSAVISPNVIQPKAICVMAPTKVPQSTFVVPSCQTCSTPVSIENGPQFVTSGPMFRSLSLNNSLRGSINFQDAAMQRRITAEERFQAELSSDIFNISDQMTSPLTARLSNLQTIQQLRLHSCDQINGHTLVETINDIIGMMSEIKLMVGPQCDMLQRRQFEPITSPHHWLQKIPSKYQQPIPMRHSPFRRAHQSTVYHPGRPIHQHSYEDEWIPETPSTYLPTKKKHLKTSCPKPKPAKKVKKQF